MMLFSPNGVTAAPVNFVPCALRPGRVRTAPGPYFEVERGLEVLEYADALIIPGWPDADEPVPVALQRALRAMQTRGAHIAAFCLGSFVIAAAGLLDGRRATTHPELVGTLTQRYPLLRVQANCIYTRQDNVWTSPGGVPAFDLCLQLLQELEGATVADRLAAELVRNAPVSSHLPLALTRSSNDRDDNRRMQQLLDWMAAHPDAPQDLQSLARRMHMTVRTFTRRFKQITGTSVGGWYQQQRLFLARQLLGSSTEPLKAIADRAGFPSASVMRTAFRRTFDTSPSEYRRMVCSPAREKPSGYRQH